MLLKPLTDALALVNDRITNFAREFTNNELQTRLSLVDPVLKALGWDPQDPIAVKVEYPVPQRKRNNMRVDYALLDSKREPVAFIEAKKLGTDLGPAHHQLFEYAVGKTVPYAVATNGADWAIYKQEQTGTDFHSKRLLAVSIRDQSPTVTAIKLLSLWRGLLTSQSSIDQIAPAMDSLIAATSADEDNLISPVDASSGPDSQLNENGQFVQSSAERSRIEATLSTATEASNNGFKLRELVLPDNTVINCKAFAAMLRAVIEWLHRTNRLDVELPWNTRRTRTGTVLNSEPHQANGKRMRRCQIIEGNLYMNTNLIKSDSCQIAMELLIECNEDPTRVRLSMENDSPTA